MEHPEGAGGGQMLGEAETEGENGTGPISVETEGGSGEGEGHIGGFRLARMMSGC